MSAVRRSIPASTTCGRAANAIAMAALAKQDVLLSNGMVCVDALSCAPRAVRRLLHKAAAAPSG
eukprot:scaffold143325_cov205-Phaeocystis_antarctica.AAC.1